MSTIPANLETDSDSAVETFRRLPIVEEWGFRPIKLKDRPLYDQFTAASEFPVDIWSSNFAYLWAHTRIPRQLVILRSEVDGILVTWILTTNGRLYLPCLPVGPGNPEHVIGVLQRCEALCTEWNQISRYTQRPVLAKMSSNQLEFFQRFDAFNENFSPKLLTGVERHLSVQKLTSLTGKKFSTIRYKLNKLQREYPGVKLRNYMADDFADVVELGRQWKKTSGSKHRRLLDSFYFKPTVKYHKSLGLENLVVEVDGKIIGMTTGGILPTGQAWGFLTKFDNSYEGISEYMVVAMAKRINELDPSVEFINVGTDFGNEQLAMAKEKFRPAHAYQRYALNSLRVL
jgi:uncharacterized protein